MSGSVVSSGVTVEDVPDIHYGTRTIYRGVTPRKLHIVAKRYLERSQIDFELPKGLTGFDGELHVFYDRFDSDTRENIERILHYKEQD